MSFLITGCSTSQKQDFLDSSWVVTKLVINNQDVPKTNDVVLKIINETTFSIKLDANTCGGNMTITKNKISIAKGIRCTRMCCDSKFSLAVIKALEMVDSYTFKDQNFTLIGLNNTRIYFKKYDSKLTKLKSTSNITPKGDFIYFEKEPCFGNCPTYTMKIYENGYVYFKSNRLTRKPPPDHYVVSPDKVTSLFTKINSLDFKNYKNLYTDTRIADLTGTVIEYKGKKINLMYGYPKELGDLSKMIESFAHATGNFENETKIR